MAEHRIDPLLTDQVIVSRDYGGLNRHIAVTSSGSAPVGTLTLTAKPPGGEVFEEIPDGIIDLAAPVSVQVEGAISEINVNLAGVTGVDTITLVDTQRIK